jgi:hypothetical protein
MQRQEDRKAQPGQPVQQRGKPQQVFALQGLAITLAAGGAGDHGSVTAATARRPSANSAKPSMDAAMPARRSSSGDHSAKMLRSPIAAWIDAATTNRA